MTLRTEEMYIYIWRDKTILHEVIIEQLSIKTEILAISVVGINIK